MSEKVKEHSERLESIPDDARSTISSVRSEMEKDGLDLLEQVVVLIMGGILGGNAFQIAQSDLPMIVELIAYILLFSTGFLLLGMVHFLVSWNRVSTSPDS